VAEQAFLDAVTAYLQAASLTPAPKSISVAEPAAEADLPCLVLSLESSARVGEGLGERGRLIVDGALPWQASIDLANPTLPEDPSFSLVDATRTILTLPHGGLVRSDGTIGSLGGSDLTVKVKGVDRPVVAGAPNGNEVTANPPVGQLTFATALPADGRVDATYFLGQWEQRIARISGVLRIDVCAASVPDAIALTAAATDALLLPGAKAAIQRLVALSITGLSSIGIKEPTTNVRRRTARCSFTFEHEINRPDSSGGIIRAIPITAHIGVPA